MLTPKLNEIKLAHSIQDSIEKGDDVFFDYAKEETTKERNTYRKSIYLKDIGCTIMFKKISKFKFVSKEYPYEIKPLDVNAGVSVSIFGKLKSPKYDLFDRNSYNFWYGNKDIYASFSEDFADVNFGSFDEKTLIRIAYMSYYYYGLNKKKGLDKFNEKDVRELMTNGIANT